jgi:excreted virulence factor EspC (type VII ESX diderm)
MGERDAARVDVPAVLDIARGYDAIADRIDAAVAAHLADPSFDGAVAGRAHAARGDALHTAIGQLADQLRTWSRASSEIASALRVSVDAYVGVEALAARRLG